jgi:Mg2+ and Co2+ transporter CorA
MGTEKLLDKMRGLLKLDRQRLKKKRDEVHALLKKLKKQQRDLEDKLKKEKDADKKKRIRQNLKVIYAQRKKGVKLYKSLKG